MNRNKTKTHLSDILGNIKVADDQQQVDALLLEAMYVLSSFVKDRGFTDIFLIVDHIMDSYYEVTKRLQSEDDDE